MTFSERKNVLRRCLNIAIDDADVTCGGRLFQKVTPGTGKARLSTVERLNSGTASWLVEVDRSLCRDGTSATWWSMTANSVVTKRRSYSNSTHQRSLTSFVSLRAPAGDWVEFLADRTAARYDRLLTSSCRPSVRLSVTLCIVALRVGERG